MEKLKGSFTATYDTQTGLGIQFDTQQAADEGYVELNEFIGDAPFLAVAFTDADGAVDEVSEFFSIFEETSLNNVLCRCVEYLMIHMLMKRVRCCRVTDSSEIFIFKGFYSLKYNDGSDDATLYLTYKLERQ